MALQVYLQTGGHECRWGYLGQRVHKFVLLITRLQIAKLVDYDSKRNMYFVEYTVQVRRGRHSF
jgi:hypothetical protein